MNDIQFPAAARRRIQALAPAAGQSWYRIQNAAKDEAKVYVYDVIAWYGIGADQFARDLDEITAKTIHLHINSPGGDVFEGIAIYNALKNHSAKVITHVDGIAASIASIIALAGDEVRMSEGAFMMVHNPWLIVIGESKDLRDAADILDKLAESMAGIYANATGRTPKEMLKLMRDETWMNATEAQEEGFADVVEESDEEDEEAQNAFDLSIYAHAPAALTSRAPSPRAQNKTKREAERALRDAGFSHAEAKSIVARGYKAPEPRDEDEQPVDHAAVIEAMQAAVLNARFAFASR